MAQESEVLDQLRDLIDTYPLSEITAGLGALVVEEGMDDGIADLVAQGTKIQAIARRIDMIEDVHDLCDTAAEEDAEEEEVDEEDDEEEEDDEDEEEEEESA